MRWKRQVSGTKNHAGACTYPVTTLCRRSGSSSAQAGFRAYPRAIWASSMGVPRTPPRTTAHSAVLRASFPLAHGRHRLPQATRARRPRHSLLRPRRAAHASHQLAKLLEVVLREVLASANFGDPAVEVCAHLRACLEGVRATCRSVVLRLGPPLFTETTQIPGVHLAFNLKVFLYPRTLASLGTSVPYGDPPHSMRLRIRLVMSHCCWR